MKDHNDLQNGKLLYQSWHQLYRCICYQPAIFRLFRFQIQKKLRICWQVWYEKNQIKQDWTIRKSKMMLHLRKIYQQLSQVIAPAHVNARGTAHRSLTPTIHWIILGAQHHVNKILNSADKDAKKKDSHDQGWKNTLIFLVLVLFSFAAFKIFFVLVLFLFAKIKKNLFVFCSRSRTRTSSRTSSRTNWYKFFLIYGKSR